MVAAHGRHRLAGWLATLGVVGLAGPVLAQEAVALHPDPSAPPAAPGAAESPVPGRTPPTVIPLAPPVSPAAPSTVQPAVPSGAGTQTVGGPLRRSQPAGQSLALGPALPAGAEPGGFSSFLQSCLCGPRIGLEANEGKPATPVEYINFFVPIIVPIQALGQNGFPACCFSFSVPCLAYGLDPRTGLQWPQRKVRTIEWMRVVPILNVYASIVVGFEAAEGRTMSEIVAAEQLERSR